MQHVNETSKKYFKAVYFYYLILYIMVSAVGINNKHCNLTTKDQFKLVKVCTLTNFFPVVLIAVNIEANFFTYNLLI